MDRTSAGAGALIMGATLSDASSLGSPEWSIKEHIFRTKHPTPPLSAFDFLIAINRDAPFAPTLIGDIRDLYDSLSDDPLALALALLAEEYEPAGPPSFPMHIFGQARPEEATPISFDVADAHLHSGASVSLQSLMDLLVRSERALPKEAIPFHTSDRGGSHYSVVILMGALRLYLRFVLTGANSLLAKPRSAHLLNSGTFWEAVRNCMLSFGGDNELLDEILSGTSGEIPSLAMSDVPHLLSDFVRNASIPERRNTLGLLSALCLFNVSVGSNSGEGLSRFVDRFEGMGLIRDLGAGSDRRMLVRESCLSVFSSERVVAAEFRKTFVVGSRTVGELELSISASLRDHLLGASDFAADMDRSVRLTMPLGFLRDRDAPKVDPERWTARYALSGVSRLALAFVRARRSSTVVRQFIDGLDVAGDEYAVPNWPFLAVYDYIRSVGLDRLVLSVHAGESFAWRMQGLRRIGECLVSPAGVDRIGHALALDDAMAESIMGRGGSRLPVLEVVSDLCWLSTVFSGASEVSDLLEEVCVRTGLSGDGIGPRELASGWMSLHSYAGLQDVGIVGRDAAWSNPVTSAPQGFNDYADSYFVNGNGASSLAAWLLAYRRPGRDPLGGVLDSDFSRRYLALQDRYWEAARDALVSAMIERGVVVEMCPTSNARLAGLRSLKSAHLARFDELGLTVTVSSDDPVIFSTSIEQEFSRVTEAFGLPLASAWALTSVRNCARGCASDHTPQSLTELAGHL